MTAAAWTCWLCGTSGDGEPPRTCPGCGADEEEQWAWRIVEYGTDADWRWACLDCWSEGTGTPPDACPDCGGRDHYRTATHGRRPLREVFDEVLAALGVPPEEPGQ